MGSPVFRWQYSIVVYRRQFLRNKYFSKLECLCLQSDPSDRWRGEGAEDLFRKHSFAAPVEVVKWLASPPCKQNRRRLPLCPKQEYLFSHLIMISTKC